MTQKNAILSVQNWLKHVVLKHNFCPYAKAPFEQGTIQFRAFTDSDMLALLETMARCLIQLDKHTKSTVKSAKIETTLLIIDNTQSLFLGNFMDYLDALDVANDFLTHPRDFIQHFSTDFQQQYVLPSQSLKKLKNQSQNQISNDWSVAYQIASFHPHYYFADPDARENYTNRSPYPIFHLLRNQTLDAVRVNDKQADAIVGRNCQTLRKMPADAFNQVVDIAKLGEI